MCMDARDNWIYFLKLSRELPREYIHLDQAMKVHQKSLVPVTLKGLIETSSKSGAVHIIVYIHSLNELRYFNRRANKILKYLMKNSRVNIYIASSFSQVGDGSILKRKQYNFVKLPVSRSEFCSNVAHMIEMRENELYKWPGGKSPRMSLAG